MRIAVVIPSRLQVNPLSGSGALYVERAIASVHRQTVAAEHEIDACVGLSPGGGQPPGVDGVAWVTAAHPGQAAALNAAVKCAGAFDLLTFLEDDDTWEPRKLEYQLEGIKAGFGLVTCNQRETTPAGDYVRVNDFATTSGWLMTREAWGAIGEFDTAFRWHLDNDWLGRFNDVSRRSSATRLHLVEAGADAEPRRDWLRNVMQFSKVATTQEREPLVNRTVNPGGGMARIQHDIVAWEESQREHARLIVTYGGVPW